MIVTHLASDNPLRTGNTLVIKKDSAEGRRAVDFGSYESVLSCRGLFQNWFDIVVNFNDSIVFTFLYRLSSCMCLSTTRGLT